MVSKDKSIRDTDKLVPTSPKPKQGRRTEDKTSIRDTNPIVTAEVTPKPQYTENPTRKTEDKEYCLSCQTLLNLNGVCPKCNLSRDDIKRKVWSKYHAIQGKM